MKKIQRISAFILCIILLSFSTIFAQNDSTKKFHHKFTTFHLEARADFDYLKNYQETSYYDRTGNPKPSLEEFGWQDDGYGFHGKYFNFLLGGDIGDHISYFIRQRFIAKPGSVSFFDNTDFLYLQYKFNKNWSIRLGKEALYIGGYEYDAPPIDVHFYTNFWSQIYCFQIGASGTYTDNSGKNKLTFQFANSPYIYYNGAGNEWQKGLFSYNLFWNGNYDWFSTLYSVNIIEYQRGKFIEYVSLGNKFTFDKFQFYVDYMNRIVNPNKFFSDFTVVGRLDWQPTKSINLFAKAGYDQNFAENKFTESPIDMMMTPDEQYYFYGLGIEYRPSKYPDLRLHAFVANKVNLYELDDMISPEIIKYKDGVLNFNVGASWRIDFMKFLPSKLK